MPDAEIIWSPLASVALTDVSGVELVNRTGYAAGETGGNYIVLVPRREFLPVGTGDPTHWLPLSRGGIGTRRYSAQLGMGEVLTYDESSEREAAGVQDTVGANLFGGTVEGQTTVTITVIVDLLDPAEVPAAGDFFSMEGDIYEITRRVIHAEEGAQKVMTLAGIRWEGLTARRPGTDMTGLTLT